MSHTALGQEPADTCVVPMARNPTEKFNVSWFGRVGVVDALLLTCVGTCLTEL